ncbi:MAG: hypothetical protein JKZ00_02125 [Flavobacteriaceae bacterium]|nr:hypothetical protein [Flavobacteriaceae bacterium]
MKNSNKVFDYRALRLLIGLIALSIPIMVSIISTDSLASISASYYSEARDAFVGMLFIVGAFMWAYNGHSSGESNASKIAALAAICVAIFPTSKDNITNTTSIIHYVAAAIFFLILAYFCLFSFRKKTKGLKGKKGLRSKIYLFCGLIIVGAIVTMLINLLIPFDESLNIVFWSETIALIAFGVAWIVAGKYFSFLVDEDEALKLFG